MKGSDCSIECLIEWEILYGMAAPSGVIDSTDNVKAKTYSASLYILQSFAHSRGDWAPQT
jgi:hypothetical protein